ncbi:hypothetical protein HNR44_000349 [Geomicrobium halophilum]|uniref:Spermatogenesis-associated protein 20-like TRX domain-containing protein n=1 Tax=Geomicrobium halophilum TaxID=549000 RepID=A0A841PHY4_9BACL|nr:thioredoxin domain-containing protein [Geomicrobium halophilum]MBB6448400.1 hypothetical protein [Geomicrobium halophilum]
MPNRLIDEKSPYLLEHAHNPVDWYPWGEEAFDRAKKENKPVFLSIGYSSCHWCHVMANESFEDEEVAALLNQDYISIKVDREERPDIDSIYMDACQAMNGHGGWPLTAFLTPDQAPFYVGTYFPKKSRYQIPGMLDALPQIAEQFHNNQDKIADVASRVQQALSQGFSEDQEEIGKHTLEQGFAQLEEQFDEVDGGLKGEPKFPMPQQILYLLRYASWAGNSGALEMATKTLRQMRKGGIYDHVGGGFARYSVDERWLVPHFEKMLYDNSLLALAYTEAYQLTGDSLYKRTTEEILNYLMRGMRDESGGFHSAEDADSEGVEGKFYVWTKSEVEEVLGREAALFCEAYNISEAGNFEGKSIPNQLEVDQEKVAAKHSLSQEMLEKRLQECRAQLFAARERRMHPHKDDKILMSWNGYAIAAFAKAGAALQMPAYTAAAEKAFHFLESNLIVDGRLMVRYRDGEVKEKGFIDDYANFLWASLELYHATYEASYLEKARRIAQDLKRLFETDQGGFYFTGTDAETLLTRPSSWSDGASPSGNSVASIQLLRLAEIVADQSLFDDVHNLLRTASWRLEHYPIGHLHLLQALLMQEWRGKTLVIVKGNDHTLDEDDVVKHVRTTFIPHIQPLVVKESDEYIPTFAKDFTSLDGKTTYYLCENFACQRPTTDAEQVINSL